MDNGQMGLGYLKTRHEEMICLYLPGLQLKNVNHSLKLKLTILSGCDIKRKS